MRKGKDVIGKPIVALEGGERLASVHDLVFDQDANQLLAFLVDEGGWFSSAKVLPFDAVSSMGDDAVIITSRDQIVSATTLPRVDAILHNNNMLKGTTLMTTDGKNLGKLADLYFEEGTGRVLGYDVTGGLFADVASGRSFVPSPKTLTIGEDVAFVPPETALEMEEQVGGVRGALTSAGQTVSGAASNVADKAKEVAGNVADATKERQKAFVVGKTASRDVAGSDGSVVVASGATITQADADRAEAQGALGALFTAAGGSVIADAASTARERVTTATAGAADRSLEGTRGRRVGADVRAENGLLVAAEGQIVTEEVVERARRYGREPQLVAAVFRDQAGGVASATGERIAAGAQTVKEGASSLFERARGALSDTRDRAAQANEERRINGALGRPVTRVILDQADNVILNVGELITHKAVNDAREAGVLEILLDSVYTETPELNVDDLRAPEPGRASLEAEHGQLGQAAGDPNDPANRRPS